MNNNVKTQPTHDHSQTQSCLGSDARRNHCPPCIVNEEGAWLSPPRSYCNLLIRTQKVCSLRGIMISLFAKFNILDVLPVKNE